jgi:hypothetical protein
MMQPQEDVLLQFTIRMYAVHRHHGSSPLCSAFTPGFLRAANISFADDKLMFVSEYLRGKQQIGCLAIVFSHLI